MKKQRNNFIHFTSIFIPFIFLVTRFVDVGSEDGGL